MPSNSSGRGFRVKELAALLRVGKRRVVGWIEDGSMPAVNVAGLGQAPRYVVLPSGLETFQRRRSAAQPAPPPRRRRTTIKDYYPD